MRSLCFCLILTFNINLFSQSINGEYLSFKTSYKDEVNKSNDFVEESKFNIAIHVTKEGDGRVVVQDPRIPRKLLIYKIKGLLEDLSDDNTFLKIFNCVSEHLDVYKEEKIVLYTDGSQRLNLMISDINSTQMFFDLRKEKGNE